MNTNMFTGFAPVVAALSLVVASPTVATTPAGVAWNDVRAAVPVLPLRPLSMAMVMKAGAAGTGCSWSLMKDGRTRFAAADDHAVVRLATRVVRMRPTAGAGDLFPFTHDRWTGDGVTVMVTPIGRSTWKGTEVTLGAADLQVRIGSYRWVGRGRLNCGS